MSDVTDLNVEPTPNAVFIMQSPANSNSGPRVQVMVSPNEYKEDSIVAFLLKTFPEYDFYIQSNISSSVERKTLLRTSLFAAAGEYLPLVNTIGKSGLRQPPPTALNTVPIMSPEAFAITSDSSYNDQEGYVLPAGSAGSQLETPFGVSYSLVKNLAGLPSDSGSQAYLNKYLTEYPHVQPSDFGLTPGQKDLKYGKAVISKKLEGPSYYTRKCSDRYLPLDTDCKTDTELNEEILEDLSHSYAGVPGAAEYPHAGVSLTEKDRNPDDIRYVTLPSVNTNSSTEVKCVAEVTGEQPVDISAYLTPEVEYTSRLSTTFKKHEIIPVKMQIKLLLRSGNHRISIYTLDSSPRYNISWADEADTPTTTQVSYRGRRSGYSWVINPPDHNFLLEQSRQRGKLGVFLYFSSNSNYTPTCAPVDKDLLLNQLGDVPTDANLVDAYNKALESGDVDFAKMVSVLNTILPSYSKQLAQNAYPILYINNEVNSKYKGISSFIDSGVQEVLFDSVINFANPISFLPAGYHGYQTNSSFSAYFTSGGDQRYSQELGIGQLALMADALGLNGKPASIKALTAEYYNANPELLKDRLDKLDIKSRLECENIYRTCIYSNFKYSGDNFSRTGLPQLCGLPSMPLPNRVCAEDGVSIKMILYKNGKPKILACPVKIEAKPKVTDRFVESLNDLDIQVSNEVLGKNPKQLRGMSFISMYESMLRFDEAGFLKNPEVILNRLDQFINICGIPLTFGEFVNVLKNKETIPLYTDAFVPDALDVNVTKRYSRYYIGTSDFIKLASKIIDAGGIPYDMWSGFKHASTEGYIFTDLIDYTKIPLLSEVAFTMRQGPNSQYMSNTFNSNMSAKLKQLLISGTVENIPSFAEIRSGAAIQYEGYSDLPQQTNRIILNHLLSRYSTSVIPVCLKEQIPISEDLMDRVKLYVLMKYL